MTNPTLPTDAEILADGRPFVRCGCGFLAASNDATENRYALEEHHCSLAAQAQSDRRWYDGVFSLWGLLIVFIIASAILAGMGVRW